MSRIAGIRRFLHIERDRAGVKRAVDDELQFHFDMTMRDLMNGGMSPGDARRETERRFGDLHRTRERLARIDRSRVGRERRTEWWSAFSQDLRYALRGLRLKPGFAIAVIVTLGLGIGANATMFGIVDRLLFRPPNYLIAPDRAHQLYFARILDGKDFAGHGAPYQRFLDLTRSTTTMDVVAAYSPRRLAVGLGESARELPVGAASASLWQLFDARPVIGRFFSPDEDRPPNGSRVVVLSYDFWQSRYARSPGVLGTAIDIGPAKYIVIGVAPRGFASIELRAPSAFIPITAAAADEFGSQWTEAHAGYNMRWLEVYGRRKRGTSVAAAESELSDAYRRSYQAQIDMEPRTPPIAIAKPRIVLESILSERGPTPSRDTKVATWLLGVAGVVLLIAAANVGNLLLGRALHRRREIAVRIALGVSRGRLTAQLLIEGMVIAVLGALAGLLVAEWGGRVLRATLMPGVEWQSAIADRRVVLFASASALLAGLIAGLAPVVQAGRADVAAALKSGQREGHGQRSPLSTALLAFQAALSVVLLVGAGLFVRSARNVEAVHLGYDADRLLWIELRLRGAKLDSARQVALRRDMMDRARQNPLVENATLVYSVPFSATFGPPIVVPGVDSARSSLQFALQGATPSYFATTGTRILRGRGVSPDDRANAPLVTIVSESMARYLWPDEDAIGKCIKMRSNAEPCRTVVGIAEDVKQDSFGDESTIVHYVPATQWSFVGPDGQAAGGVYVRVRGNDAAAHADAVRRDLQRLMPGASYLVARPMSQVLERATRSWRLGATMFAVFGGLALALAAIGLYGVIARDVAQRTHEIGVRVALGADGEDVVRLIVGQGLGAVVPGVALGALIALAAGRWIAPLLFHVSPADPLVVALVILTLLAVAIAASWLPALRATRVDPNEALRAD